MPVPVKEPARYDMMVISADRLPPQNPLTLAAFVLVEFATLARIEDLYAVLGQSFVDISSDEDVVADWAALGLTEDERPFLLQFGSGNCSGEMELIFNGGRLVQGGVQVVGDPLQALSVRGIFEAVRAIIELRLYEIEASPSHVMFSDNHVNGYLRSVVVPGGASMVFRVADSMWCRKLYGPGSALPMA